MSTQGQVFVNQDSPRSESEGNWIDLKGSKRGEVCVVDFYTAMALEQRGFQVRAGALSAPLVGDVAITDQVCEMATEAESGTTIMPVELSIVINLGGGTLHEYAAKSRPWTVAVTGTSFTALPMYLGGVSASGTASYVSAAGGVDVGANEDVTLDRLHYHFSQPIAMGAWDGVALWTPIAPPPIAGRSIFYVQIAATGTGPSYFSHYNFIKLPTVNIS